MLFENEMPLSCLPMLKMEYMMASEFDSFMLHSSSFNFDYSYLLYLRTRGFSGESVISHTWL